jgi:alkylation response protein AidB-like acyl-CoA dehydrogenase
MNFELNEDQSAFQDAARSFTEAELLPHAAQWDEDHTFPIDALRKAAEQGFAGIYVRDDVGGSALTRLDAAIIFEELAAADPSTAAYISIHNMASWMIDAFANDELRHRYLPKADHDGALRQLLPDRTGRGFRRRLSSHARRA